MERRKQRVLCRHANHSFVQNFLALAAKRVALGKSQIVACLDVSTALLHAEARDEINIKMGADTLRLTREQLLPNLQPIDSEGLKVDKALCGY